MRKTLDMSAEAHSVLVVEDDADIRDAMVGILESEGYTVSAASHGAEALAQLQAGNRPCLILLDLMMPGMDGFEVCRILKNNPLTAHLPVVMVTALDQPSDRLKGLDAGADDFLTKPIDDTALFSRVRSLVRLKAVTDELRSRALASREGALVPLVSRAEMDIGLVLERSICVDTTAAGGNVDLLGG